MVPLQHMTCTCGDASKTIAILPPYMDFRSRGKAAGKHIILMSIPPLPSRHRSFYTWLLDCTRERSLARGRAVHAQIVKNGSADSCVYVANSLVNFYAKCGHLEKSHLVFDLIPQRDVVSWNSLINAYSRVGSSGATSVMELFHRMRRENTTFPDAHTFAGVFTAASYSLGGVFLGKQAQALAIKTATFDDVFVGSSLLNVYCKAGLVSEARKVFDGMPERNAVSWATMVSGYASQRLVEQSLEIFESMRREAPELNEFVITSLVSAFSAPEWLDNGQTLHSLAAKNGLLAFVSVSNAFVTMYAKCGSMEGSAQMFESLNDKDSISWSAMITGFTQSGAFQNALKLFSKMHSAGIPPTEHTLVGVLNSCSDLAAVEEGKQLHSYSLKLGFETQIFVLTALVDMYAKCGLLKDARKGFDLLQKPDIVLWTSMISGCVQNGENEDAFTLYCKMQNLGVFPNELTMASVLKACSSLAALEQGKQIHGCIVKYGFKVEPPIGSSLSTMYAKCGSLDDAGTVFNRMTERDVLSWNAMISGLSHNGHGIQALELFQEMQLEGLTKPDDVTFVNILSACSHMGLVDEAWQHFNTMIDEFAMVPTLDHYACMVDALSRAGLVREAKEFIESVPIDHGLCLWRILLSACRNYRSYELGAYAGEKLIELGSKDSSAYVMLSSIYNALGRRRDVERVRGLMKTRGANKDPGCSWIELKGVVHVFVVGDGMHPWIEEIRGEVRRLLMHMRDDEGCHPALDLAA